MLPPTTNHRVLNTPELVHAIAGRMDKSDLACMLRTNRLLHLWTKPLLYAHISALFRVIPVNGFLSPDAMPAFARNVLFVGS